MAERLVELFPEVARVAADLIRHPEVGRRWADESACADMSVGALANHLAGQATRVVLLMSAEPHDGPSVTAVEHYRRAAWVTAGHDGDANVGIREADEEAASTGYADLLARVDRDLGALPAALAAALQGTRRPDTVFVPWQGWSLATAEFLLTRALETLVHSDDLAASIGVETPRFPDEAADAVLGLLASVSAERHGQAAVLRALSRPQRAAGPVSAFAP